MAFYPTPMTSVDLSIIVCNWNSKGYLRNCIASILFNSFGIEYEIKAVNSDSFDDRGGHVAGRLLASPLYPERPYYEARTRPNLGTKYARGKTLLFLNLDTDVPEHTIERLCSRFRSRVGKSVQ